jgi:uncharacterized membrane protein
MARRPRWLRRFLTAADLDAIAGAVTETERTTSGEIRVHLDAACPGDPLARAISVFERLRMHRTARRNGVLVYVAIEDRKLAVIGDTGVHARVPPDYWDGLARALATHFREGRPREGLLAVVGEVGRTLARHFPRDPGDRDELEDRVSLG